jgi:hypothetical protein
MGNGNCACPLYICKLNAALLFGSFTAAFLLTFGKAESHDNGKHEKRDENLPNSRHVLLLLEKYRACFNPSGGLTDANRRQASKAVWAAD